ncbi:MAG TPA: helix-turn-helix transcriptional regulator [Vampirovibrionales bacterium]
MSSNNYNSNNNQEIPSSASEVLEDIGSQLKESRLEKELTIEEVCSELKMHPNLVNALEHGDFNRIAGAALYFASLRNYSGFLGLDTEALTRRCKNNQFLFLSLQGQGSIQKSSVKTKDNVISHVLLNENESYKHEMEEEAEEMHYEEQGSIEHHETPYHEEESINDIVSNDAVKPRKKRKAAAKLLLPLIFLGLLGFGLYSFSGQLVSFYNNVFGGLAELAFTGRTMNCAKLRLEATDIVTVQIESQALGSEITNRLLFPEEVINFGDSEGVKITLSESDGVVLFNGNREIELQKFKQEDGSYYINCKK